MNFKKLGTALFAGLLLASPLATVSAQDTVKVGGNFELSGAAAAYGTSMASGLKLAVKQYNEEHGGVNGKKVEAQVEDNKSDKTEAAAAATKLVTDSFPWATLRPVEMRLEVKNGVSRNTLINDAGDIQPNC